MSDDLTRLVVDLRAAGEKAEKASYKALVVEAAKMKAEWQAGVKGARGLPGLARAISYDIRPAGLRAISAEVGYDKTGQGSLGNIVEFGSARQGPIRPMGAEVLAEGAQRFETYLLRLDPL